MFDHIGTDPEEDGNRRRALASFYTLLGLGGALGLGLGLAALQVGRALDAPAIEAPMVELAEPVDEARDEAPPGLPARPAPRVAGGGPSEAPDPAPPPPSTDSARVPPVVEAFARPPAVGAGGGEGPGIGPGEGPGTSGPGGGGGGGGGGGPRVVHASELSVKRRVEPDYPSSARALGLGEQRCVARVEIDADGVPARIEVAGCAEVFHPETRRALAAWRWYPVRLEGQRVPVVTTVAVTYTLE